MGIVSSQTLSSARVILEGLRALEQLLKKPSPNYKIDMYTCLTVQVKNLHAMGHFKEQFPSSLQCAQNFANTVYENIKRVVRWAVYYSTHEKSYYPVVSTVAHKGKTQVNIELDTQRFFVIQNNFTQCTTIFRDAKQFFTVHNNFS